MKKIKYNELFFFIAYIMYIFYYVVLQNSTFINIVDPLIRYVMIITIYFYFAIKNVFDTKLEGKSIVEVIILLSIGICIFYVSKMRTILELFLVIYSARNIEFRKIAKVTFYELSILIAGIVFSSWVGIIDNYVFIRNDIKRYCLGFIYVGKLSAFMLEILFLYLYLQEKKGSEVKYSSLMLFTCINCIIYYYTNLRTNFYLSIILIIAYIFYVKKDMIKIKINYQKNILTALYITCFLVSWFFVINYNNTNPIMMKINSLLTYRLSVTSRELEKYDITLFGNNMQMKGTSEVNRDATFNEYSYIDCAYIQMVLRYGIIFSVMFSIGYVYLIRISVERNEKTLILWLIILCVSAMVDDTILNLVYNCSLILLFENIRNYKTNTKNKNINNSIKNLTC